MNQFLNIWYSSNVSVIEVGFVSFIIKIKFITFILFSVDPQNEHRHRILMDNNIKLSYPAWTKEVNAADSLLNYNTDNNRVIVSGIQQFICAGLRLKKIFPQNAI